MKTIALVVIAGLVGAVCGVVSYTPLLAGRWTNLIVWSLAGIVLGLFTQGRRLILLVGIVYGFVLSVVFLLYGFHGSPDKLPGFLVLTLGLSVVGALGGLVTVFIGSRLRRLFR